MKVPLKINAGVGENKSSSILLLASLHVVVLVKLSRW